MLWRTYKHKIVANSTAEAEYVTLNEAVRNAQWLRNILEEIGYGIPENPEVYEDNTSAILTVKGQKNGILVKHLDVKYQYVKDLYEKGYFNLNYVETEKQVADMLTKSLPTNKFKEFKRCLGIRTFHEEESEIVGANADSGGA